MYEVIIRTKGQERVIRTGIRRENGAIAERDIAADSEYRNKVKRTHGDPTARVVRGPIDGDPNAEAIVYFDAHTEHPVVTVVTYGRVLHTNDLLDALTASVMALTVGANV
jgi:hypothetical protein